MPSSTQMATSSQVPQLVLLPTEVTLTEPAAAAALRRARAESALVSAKTDEERAAIIDHLRRVDPVLADELTKKDH
jgi:hypothetical protein